MFTEQSGNNLADIYICGSASLSQTFIGKAGGLTLTVAQVCLCPFMSLPISFSFSLSAFEAS